MLNKFLKRLSPAIHDRKPGRQRRKPADQFNSLESLEARQLMSVTINLSAGNLYDSAGANLPLNSTLVLLADADNDGSFGDLTNPSTFSPDAGDVVLARMGTNGLLGADNTDASSLLLDNAGLEGVDLLLVWYDLPFNMADTGPGSNVNFQTFRTDSIEDSSSTSWFYPADGSTIALNFLTLAAGGSQAEIEGRTSQITSPPVVNVAPVLDPIGDQQAIEGQALNFTATASDANVGDSLTFSLDAPSLAAGMTINPNTGAFTWTPGAAQGPGVFPVTVTVTDNGAPTLSDSETFNITVIEQFQVNLALNQVLTFVKNGNTSTFTFKGATGVVTFEGEGQVVPNPKGFTVTGNNASISDITADSPAGKGQLTLKNQGPQVEIEDLNLTGGFSKVTLAAADFSGDINANYFASGSFGTIADNHLFNITGAGNPISLFFADVTDMTLNSVPAIKSLTLAGNWTDTDPMTNRDTITAPSIGKLTGNGTLFNASLNLDGSDNAKATLKTASFKSAAIQNALWRITGAIGSVTAGRLLNSTIFAGINNALTTLPTLANQFVQNNAIKSITVKGLAPGQVAFDNSQIAAANIGKVTLGLVDVENADVATGIVARDAIKSASYVSPTNGTVKLKPANLPAVEDDFVVRLV